MEEETLLQKTVLFEMGGKNEAIHEYDKMLWQLRMGFLTVFFAIWGLIIKTAIETGNIFKGGEMIYLMKVFAIVIVIGALLVDANYVRRKYKVIRALNLLYRRIAEDVKNASLSGENYKNLLMISGTSKTFSDNDDKMLLKGTGYIRELWICFVIYIFPLAALFIGFSILV